LKGFLLLGAALLAMLLAMHDPPGSQVLARRALDFPLQGERASLDLDLPRTLPAGKGRLGLYLDGVDLGRGAYWEVYANLPAGTEPRPEGPHYLGTLTSFGPKGGESRVGYDLSKLAGAGWSGKLTLTFVRKGLVGQKTKGTGRITGVRVVRE